MRRSQGSSAASSKHSHDDHGDSQSIPVDTLVNHLLVAKRSLSSMTLVLRANELATTARHSHEDVAILAAQAGFLRSSILDQAAILVKVRRSLQATYDWGKKDFRKVVKAMDQVDGELGGTMDMLRNTGVQSVFRQKGEDRQNLLDFVDEASVHSMRDAMKKSIEEMQVSDASLHKADEAMALTRPKGHPTILRRRPIALRYRYPKPQTNHHRDATTTILRESRAIHTNHDGAARKPSRSFG